MSLLDTIWDVFRKPTSVTISITPRITNIELGQILKPFCTNQWLSDENYQTINEKSLKDFLRTNPVSGRKYLVDAHDCDDFSFELMGDVSEWNSDGAFGIVWGNRASDGAGHAWNFFIDENKQLKFIEPQNDQIFAPTTEKVWIMII
jgi:hypothetical protein